MPANRSHIAAINQDYLFRGVIVTGGRRLSDLMNDRLSPTIKLLDVRVYGLSNPGTPIYSAPQLFLRKERFDIVAILKEERNAITQRLYAYVPKERRAATLFLSGFQIEGALHLKQKQDATGPLSREDMFIPMTDASLVAVNHPRLTMPSATLLLREAALDAYSISEEVSTSRAV